MAFKFNSENERIAIAGLDKEIYPALGSWFNTRFYINTSYPFRLCSDFLSTTGSLSTRQTSMPALSSEDLRDFVDNGLESVKSSDGALSLKWCGPGVARSGKDCVYNDNFRSVITFRSIELALGPLPNDSTQCNRISIGVGDVQDCLNAALREVLSAKSDPDEQIATVMGQGSVIHPRYLPQHVDTPEGRERVPFEWRVTRVPEDRLAKRVQRWRYDKCGGSTAYQVQSQFYLRFLQYNGLPDPRQGTREQGDLALYRGSKRSSEEMGASEELGPGSKRQNTDSSQLSSSSQSSFSSPEISRAPLVAGWSQPIMGPPPPVGPGQPGTNIEHMVRCEQGRTGSRSSQGSIGSAASLVGALTFQSPSEGSPEGLGLRSEGSPWVEPQEVVGRDHRGQFGGGYEAQALPYGQQGQGFVPQIPGHAHQGPGQVQQTPAYGQATEVYGHMRTDFQGPPQREFRVGIAHRQNRGQPHVPVGPAPEQHSYHPGHAASVDTQSGRGYAGDPGHNVPAVFPLMQPAMYGGQPTLPQQPQHVAAGPQERQDDRSIVPHAPLTAPPQRHLPSGTEPMHHRQDIEPLPPPAMRDIHPAQFQAQPPLPPVGQNDSSSMSSATLPMPAEHEDVRLSHQGTRVAQPLLHTGGHGDPRMYESPPLMPQDLSSYQDVFMGAGKSDDDASDEDDFHRR